MTSVKRFRVLALLAVVAAWLVAGAIRSAYPLGLTFSALTGTSLVAMGVAINPDLFPIPLVAAVALSVTIGWAVSRCIRSRLQDPEIVRSSTPTRDAITLALDHNRDLRQRNLFLVALLSILLLGALNGFARFDAMLQSFHLPGEAAFGIDAATAILDGPDQRAAHLANGVQNWHRYAARQPSLQRPDSKETSRPGDARTVLAWQLGIDSFLLVPLYALLLVVVIGWTRDLIRGVWWNELRTAPEGSGHLEQGVPTPCEADCNRGLRWCTWALVITAFAAFADWGENALVAALVTHIWTQLAAGESMNSAPAISQLSCWSWSGPLCNKVTITVLSLFTWVKWLGISAALAFVLAATRVWLHPIRERARLAQSAAREAQQRAPSVRDKSGNTLGALRLPLLLVMVFATLLFSNDQFPDIIRRWITTPLSGAISFALTCLLAAGIGWTSSWLLRPRPPLPAGTADQHEPADAATPAWLGAAGTLGYIALWVASYLLVHQPDWWPLTVLILAGVGVTLTHPAPRPWLASHSGKLESFGLLALLAIVVFTQSIKPALPVLLALGVLVVGWVIRHVHGGESPGLTEAASNRPGSTTSDLESQGQASDPIWDSASIPYLMATSIIALLTLAVLNVLLQVTVYEVWRNSGERRAGNLVPFVAVGFLLYVGLTWRASSRLFDSLADARPRPGKPIARPVAMLRSSGTWVSSRMPTGKPIGTPVGMLLGGIMIWAALIGFYAQDELHLHGYPQWLASDTSWRPTDPTPLSAPWLGGLGVISLGLLLLAVSGCGLIGVIDHVVRTPPTAFARLGLRRVPVLSFILVWFILASLLPPEENTHDVRGFGATEGSERTRRDLATLFAAWQERQCLTPGDQPLASATARPAVPLVFVATSGGGVRSAAWTTYVLDRALGYGPDTACDRGRLLDRRRSSWIFAASGVSGGSVGLAVYAARQASYDAEGAQLRNPETVQDQETYGGSRPSGPGRGWIGQHFGQDGISATLAWMLLVESPWAMFRFPLERDRAIILEETWERIWLPLMPGRSNQPPQPPRLFDLSERAPSLPLLLLNGTSVESGCRFNTSVLSTSGRDRTEPSTRCLAPLAQGDSTGGILGTTVDLVDFLCATQDPALSTAALLSARFPVISPAGRISQCKSANQVAQPRTYVVDGGYHEGSGAATILELWLALAPLVERYNDDPTAPAVIVPFLIQIDNGYNEPSGPGLVPSQPQFLVPLATFGGSWGAGQERARQAAQLSFVKPYDLALHDGRNCYIESRYAHFALRPRPGPAAPLGWSLSDLSLDDLVDQFLTPDAADGPLDKLVENWFKPERMQVLADGNSPTDVRKGECPT